MLISPLVQKLLCAGAENCCIQCYGNKTARAMQAPGGGIVGSSGSFGFLAPNRSTPAAGSVDAEIEI